MARLAAVVNLLCFLACSGFCQEPAPKKSQKLENGFWSVPPGFISEADPSNKNGIRKPLERFKSKQNPYGVQYDASDFLKAQGMTFPPGSEAVYDEGSHFLFIRNTRENLDLMETMVIVCGFVPITNVGFEVSTLECVLPVEGSTISSNWITNFDLKHLPDKNVHLVDRVSGITKSGICATLNHILNPSSLKTSDSGSAKEKKENDALPFQSGESGTKVEFEPVVGPDGVTIDIRVKYRFRPPVANNAASEIGFESSFTTWDGYPFVLHVSPVPNQKGKFIVVVGTVRLVNAGDWNCKDLRDEAAKETADKK